MSSLNLHTLFEQAKSARDQSNWLLAIDLFKQALQLAPDMPEIFHNLALCYLGSNQVDLALYFANEAVHRQPRLWQSHIIIAKALKQLGRIEAAYASFLQVLSEQKLNAIALLGMADLALNEFGDPLAAARLVVPLYQSAEHQKDAELTTLMAALYDRDFSTSDLVQRVMRFSREALRLPNFIANNRIQRRPNKRLRVALISPLFCVSPVYFLTISRFRNIAHHCDLILFNRGTKQDWATAQFYELASEYYEVQYFSALQLANVLHIANLDILYDLGGWTDPIALQALSVKPARQQFKWVGGQSITTGLTSFDGWIGDQWQSPSCFQYLYSEPLINIKGQSVSYTPPPYMPKPAQRKSKVPVIFANPAKVSRAFLQMLHTIPGKKCFIHRQYRYSCVRARIDEILGDQNTEYICPTSHKEALYILNHYAVMIDTFPYSGGLTAREAHALGLQVNSERIGKLFCERHTAGYAYWK